MWLRSSNSILSILGLPGICLLCQIRLSTLPSAQLFQVTTKDCFQAKWSILFESLLTCDHFKTKSTKSFEHEKILIFWSFMMQYVSYRQNILASKIKSFWIFLKHPFKGGWVKKFEFKFSYYLTVKDESLGLVSVSRLQVPRLSVSSRSRTKFWNLSRLGLGLVSDEKFWDSLVLVSSCVLQFHLVLSWSRLVVFNKIKSNIQSFSLLKVGSRLGLVKKDTKTLSLVLVSPKILS